MMDYITLQLAKLTLIALQIQLAIASTPPAVLTPPSPVLSQIEALPHYAELQKLEKCESGGKYVVIIDVNGLRSYGYLQWQLNSFRRYGEKFGLIERGKTNEELRELIRDRDLQFRIADKVLGEPGGWKNWFNCLK